MNRKSLFGRFAAPIMANRTAERPDYFQARLEPLEERKLLVASPLVYVNDNWYNASHPTGPNTVGDTVINALESAGVNTVTAQYGSTAFGRIDNDGVSGGATSTLAGFGLIHDAIDPALVTIGGTVSLLEGTFIESDIVIDQPMTLKGNGTNLTGSTRSLLVPEAVSDHSDLSQEFGSGSHSGVIIYSSSVTVRNIALDGNGNGGISGTLNYHIGITTLYDGQTGNAGSYSTLHDGLIAPKKIGVVDGGGTLKTWPNILITDTRVENVFYHGIVLLPRQNETFETTGSSPAQSQQNIRNSVVTYVGDPGDRDLNRIGIWTGNIGNWPGNAFTSPDQAGGVARNTITDVGVGIKMAPWGTNLLYGDSQHARNRGSMINNTVNNARLRGFDLIFWDRTDVASGNVANFSPGNTAVGYYINHGEMLFTGDKSNGAKIGVQIHNTSQVPTGAVDNGRTPFPFLAADFLLIGPGTGVSGSVGVLAENGAAYSAMEPNLNATTSFGMSLEFNVSGFETGVKVNQASTNSQQTLILIDRLNVAGNTTGINFGNNVNVQGNWVTTDPTVVNSGATVDPGFTPFPEYRDVVSPQQTPPTGFTVNQTPATPTLATPTPPDAGDIGSGNFTMHAGGAYQATLFSTAASLQFRDFNYPLTFSLSTESNPWRTNFVPTGAQFTFFNNVTQNGSGTLLIDPGSPPSLPAATEVGAVYEYNYAPVDASGYDTIQIVARLPANAAQDVILIALDDVDGTSYWYPFAPRLLSSTTFTTLTVNINSSAVSGNDGDRYYNLSKLQGWGVVGDAGFSDGTIDPYGLELDNIAFLKTVGNDQIKVTKSGGAFVNLGVGTDAGSLLGSVRAGFVPTVGQTFIIIDNDGTADAVTGSFAGLPQGAKMSFAGGLKFSINYSGGDGNDVALVRVSSANVAPVLDLDNTVGSNDSNVTWTAPTPKTIAPNANITDSDDTNLVKVTVAITSPQAGDVLDVPAAALIGTGIVKTFDGTTLTLSGTQLVSTYQTVLRQVTYNNTTGDTANHPTLLTVNAFDFDGAGTARTSTVNIIPLVSNSTVAGRFLFYKDSFPFDDEDATPGGAASHDQAIATNKVALLPGGGQSTWANATSYNLGINGIMVDLSSGTATHASINASDFTFRVSGSSANNDPNGTDAGPVWATVGAAATISVRPGAGVGGSDRVEITWANGSIKNTWLEVTVKANTTHTGLAANSIFYFGNLVGNSGNGDDVDVAFTDSTDVIGARANQVSDIWDYDPGNTAGLATAMANPYDYNRDNNVDATDIIIARANGGELLHIMIDNPPHAPATGGGGSGGGDAGVASALATLANSASSSSAPSLPGWLVTRLRNVDLNSGPIADVIHHLDEVHTVRAHKLLVAADRIADRLGLDTTLLDEILADW